MIKGIGCDIVDLRRLDINNLNFVKKVLTINEFDVYLTKSDKGKLEYLGGRFACKEAFFKAYGIDNDIISFQDIEVLNDDTGKPVINHENTFISIAHENEYAISYVIVESI